VQEGRELAAHLMCQFLEASAKLRVNVDEAFVRIVREIQMYDKVRSSLGIDLENV
jgi:GTPase KRas protein